MRPELFRIGPVSFIGFLVFSACALGLAFVLGKIFGKKPQLKKEFFQYALFLAAAAFVLFLTKWSFPLRTYGLMVALGFVTASAAAAALAKRRGLAPSVFLDLGVVTLVSGIIGTRVFYVLFHNWSYYLEHPIEMLYIWQGGQVLYGGVIFGGVAAMVWLARKKLPVLSVMDLVMVGALIGIGFGRIGCLGSGCCYGEPWSGFLALRFPPESVAYQEQLAQGLITSAAEHSAGCWPTQIFASLFAFAMAGLLALLEKPFRPRTGLLLATGLVLYAAGRWIEETLRVNPRIGGFSAAQWTSFVVLAAGIVIGMLVMIIKPREKAKE